MINKLHYMVHFSPMMPLRIAFYRNGPSLVLNWHNARYERALGFKGWRVINHDEALIKYFPSAQTSIDYLEEQGMTRSTIESRINHSFFETVSFVNTGDLTATNMFGQGIQKEAQEYNDKLIAAYDKLAEDKKGKPHIQDVLTLLECGIPEVNKLTLVENRDD